MPKNIVICADGTGNTTVKGRGTNVFKLYEALDGNGHRFYPFPLQQVAIYHDGVGTESNKWIRLFSGAFGWGLSRNVKQLYGELARVYDAGDRIFLFGFSRGAFTVRTLAGLITTCGVLDVTRFGSNAALTHGIRHAYNLYRRKYQTELSRLIRGKRDVPLEELRQFAVNPPGGSSGDEPSIHFIGVWDTVDAVGSPFGLANVINTTIWRFKFPDTKLSPLVAAACHALAVDEARASFTPVLWDESVEDHVQPRIEQVWFGGAHSNVGGGYPRQGMSIVALDWMMTHAEHRGLRFLAAERESYRGAADANDKAYDSRSGFGTFYRWGPRDIERICERCGVIPKVHRTVFERIARNTEGYAPGSLPPQCEVVSTSATQATKDVIGATLAGGFANLPPLLRQQRKMRLVGQAGYWLMIVGALLIVVFSLRTVFSDSWAHAHTWRAAVSAFANLAVSSHWLQVFGRVLLRHPWLGPTTTLGFLLLRFAETRLDQAYSAFWHGLRARLRDAV